MRTAHTHHFKKYPHSLLPGKRCNEEGALGWDSAEGPISSRVRDTLLDLRLNAS